MQNLIKEKCNLNYKYHIYKIKSDITFYKYPSTSIDKILNYKPVCPFPDKRKKEKVAICDY